jgi:rod shape-determining protein MreC
MDKLQKGLKTLDELEIENAVLVAQNNELRAASQLLGNLEEENKRLRDALGYRERSSFRLLPAEIVGRDSTSWWSTAKINRGFAGDVAAGLPVLTADGLVGRTTTVAKDISLVLLLTDENSRVAARIEGTKEQGILTGRRVQSDAPPELVLNFLSRDANLQPGMKVFTAGVSGGVFPAGIPLGVVKEFRTRELDGEATIVPAADFSNLEDVFVVLDTP